MNTKRKLQIVIDVSMTAMLPVLMAYNLIGETAHEWIGAAMFLLFIVHHLLNYKWFMSINHGKYTAKRTVITIIDILLLFCMVSLTISGIMLSHHVFAFLNISFGMSISRTMHLLGAYWGFVIMCLHLGFHINSMTNMMKVNIKNSKSAQKKSMIIKGIVFLLSIYGAYQFVSRRILDYMLLKNQFVFFDFSEAVTRFLIDYISIMVLFAVIGYYINKILIMKRRDKND